MALSRAGSLVTAQMEGLRRAQSDGCRVDGVWLKSPLSISYLPMSFCTVRKTCAIGCEVVLRDARRDREVAAAAFYRFLFFFMGTLS